VSKNITRDNVEGLLGELLGRMDALEQQQSSNRPVEHIYLSNHVNRTYAANTATAVVHTDLFERSGLIDSNGTDIIIKVGGVYVIKCHESWQDTNTPGANFNVSYQWAVNGIIKEAGVAVAYREPSYGGSLDYLFIKRLEPGDLVRLYLAPYGVTLTTNANFWASTISAVRVG
jgi:hypothetical protein